MGTFTNCSNGRTRARPAAAVAATPEPSTLATEFWRATPLPVPKPSLNPSNPITGLDAYLSLQADLRPSFTHQTPLGALTVSAVGTPTIRWGDGSVTTGPPGYPGAPYPNGRLTHQYIDRCVGTLEVTVAWTASWRLAGDNGSLSGMDTTARVALRTEEIQAVIIPSEGPPPSFDVGPAPAACPTKPTP